MKSIAENSSRRRVPNLTYRDNSKIKANDFSIEMSPESDVEEVRMKAGRKYTNEELERSIEAAFHSGSNQFDLYFMIGLKDQDKKSIYSTIGYAAKLMRRHPAGQLTAFISPYSPFLDPGSLGFEFPDTFGFTKYADSLMDHYELLGNGITWKDFLSYRTNNLSRDDIVDLSYKAAIEFAEVKREVGIISSEKLREIEKKIKDSRLMIEIVESKQKENSEQLRESLTELDHRFTIDRGELDWAKAFSPSRLFAVLSKGIKLYGNNSKPAKIYQN